MTSSLSNYRKKEIYSPRDRSDTPERNRLPLLGKKEVDSDTDRSLILMEGTMIAPDIIQNPSRYLEVDLDQ